MDTCPAFHSSAPFPPTSFHSLRDQGKSRISGGSGRALRRAVRPVQQAPAMLSLYLDKAHAFIRFRDPSRAMDVARGLYPAALFADSSCHPGHGHGNVASRGDEQGNRQVTVPFLMKQIALKVISGRRGCKGRGVIKDEAALYAGGLERIRKLPSIDFNLTSSQAGSIKDFLEQSSAACRYDAATAAGKACRYRTTQRNCVDFVQEVFALTNNTGHFIEHFPADVLQAQKGSMVIQYARYRMAPYASSFQAVQPSVVGTAGLLLVLSPWIARAFRAAGAGCRWLLDRFWP